MAYEQRTVPGGPIPRSSYDGGTPLRPRGTRRWVGIALAVAAVLIAWAFISRMTAHREPPPMTPATDYERGR